MIWIFAEGEVIKSFLPYQLFSVSDKLTLFQSEKGGADFALLLLFAPLPNALDLPPALYFAVQTLFSQWREGSSSGNFLTS